MIDHDDLDDLLDAFLRNDLDAAKRAYVEKLIASDAAVREYIHAHTMVNTVLPRYRHTDATDLANRGMVARVERATTRHRRRTVFWFAGTCSLAAASVVVLVFGIHQNDTHHTVSVLPASHSIVSSSKEVLLPNVVANRDTAAPFKKDRRTFSRLADQPLGTTDIAEALEDLPYDATVEHLAGTAYGDNAYWLTESDMNMLLENDDES